MLTVLCPQTPGVSASAQGVSQQQQPWPGLICPTVSSGSFSHPEASKSGWFVLTFRLAPRHLDCIVYSPIHAGNLQVISDSSFLLVAVIHQAPLLCL